MKRVKQRLGPRRARLFRPWTPAEEALLGTKPDREIAIRLKRSTIAVQGHRIEKRILKYKCKRRPWSAFEEALLGRSTAADAATMLGRSIAAVYKHSEALGIRRDKPLPIGK